LYSHIITIFIATVLDEVESAWRQVWKRRGPKRKSTRKRGDTEEIMIGYFIWSREETGTWTSCSEMQENCCDDDLKCFVEAPITSISSLRFSSS
jgi:hypothetical protein